MKKGLTLEELDRSLRKKEELEREEIDRIVRESLNDLRRSLSESLSAEENIIMNAISNHREKIEEQIRAQEKLISRSKFKAMILPAIVAMSLIAGLAMSSMALSRKIVDQMQTINENETTIEKLKSHTMVWKVQDDAIIFNQGVTIEKATAGNREAVVFRKE